MKQQIKKHLFFYGTLQQQEALHYYIKDKCKFLAIGVLKGYCIYSNGFFPMMTKARPTDKVFGEVFEFTEEEYKNIINYLDGIEGQYDRVVVTIKLKDKFIKCETYIYKKKYYGILNRCKVIEGGDWKKRCENEPRKKS